MKTTEEKMEWLLEHNECGDCPFFKQIKGEDDIVAVISCSLLDISPQTSSNTCPNLEIFEEAVQKKIDKMDLLEVVTEEWEKLAPLVTDFVKDHNYSYPYHAAKIKKSVLALAKDWAEELV
jgi:hypothetical protein